MPRLRLSAADLENRTIIATIKYGMEMTHIEPPELALAMQTSVKTVYSRFKHPESFRLEELRRISDKLHIPLEQLVVGKQPA